jgi:hypothetical protein
VNGPRPEGETGEAGLSLKGRPQRGTPEGTEDGVMRRCRPSAGAPATRTDQAATCEELATNGRITTSSVQGGAGLELHEVRWRTGTDRPPASTNVCQAAGRRRRAADWRTSCPRRGLGRAGRTEVSVANTAREVERRKGFSGGLVPDENSLLSWSGAWAGWVNAPDLKTLRRVATERLEGWCRGPGAGRPCNMERRRS